MRYSTYLVALFVFASCKPKRENISTVNFAFLSPSGIAGEIHSIENYIVTGWICDPEKPGTFATPLELAVNGVITEFIPNQARPDITETACNGKLPSVIGFKFNINGLLKPGENEVSLNAIDPEDPSRNFTIGGENLAGPNLQNISQFRTPNGIEIPEGKVSVINSDVDIQGGITVKGTLVCPETGNYSIKAYNIIVDGGEFACGRRGQPFTGTLDIALREILGSEPKDPGNRALMAMRSGVIRLHGNSKKSGWYQLASNLRAGSDEISVDVRDTFDSVGDIGWRAGDEIVVAPTGFDPNETETFTIDRKIANGRFRLTSSAVFDHIGEANSHESNGRIWFINQRAEVANLSRNIRIYPDYPVGRPETLNALGGHIMAMTGGKLYIDSVSLRGMGRQKLLARYPIHWHELGDTTGQYIKNSSIADSFQRCIVVHNTNGITIDNNVCYNQIGHGFFLETESEINNTISNNLGILTRMPSPSNELLASDLISSGQSMRFGGAATFWSGNPKNTIINNVAAGYEGTGFWNSYANHCIGTNCVAPKFLNTLRFENNRAHSGRIGITWDGAPDGEVLANPNRLVDGINDRLDRKIVSAHYSPKIAPIFRDLEAYKNVESGVYFRGNTATFENFIGGDNGWSVFVAYNQIFRRSLIFGKSQFVSAADSKFLSNYYKVKGRLSPDLSGIKIYDGPFEVIDSHFADFSTEIVMLNTVNITRSPIGHISASSRYGKNRVSGVSFSPEPLYRVNFESGVNAMMEAFKGVQKPRTGNPNEIVTNWTDEQTRVIGTEIGTNAASTAGVRDIDGSLTGVPNSLVVEGSNMNNDASCFYHPSVNKGQICSYNSANVQFYVDGINSVPSNEPFLVTRISLDGGLAVKSGVIQNILDHSVHFKPIDKFPIILNGKYRYEIDFDPTRVLTGKIEIWLATEEPSVANVPEIIIRGLNCASVKYKDGTIAPGFDGVNSVQFNSIIKNPGDSSVTSLNYLGEPIICSF